MRSQEKEAVTEPGPGARRMDSTAPNIRRMESNTNNNNNTMKVGYEVELLSQSYPDYLSQGMEDTVWRVGCYNINPTTPNGQKFFILHMLVLPLIPITALVIQNSVTMNTLLGYQSRVSTIRRQVSVRMT